MNNNDVKSFIRAIALDIQDTSSVSIKPEIDIDQIVLRFTKSIRSYLRRNPSTREHTIRSNDNEELKSKDKIHDIFQSSIMPNEVLVAISKTSKHKWPNDYAMQEYHIKEQVKAINDLRSLRSSVINKPEKLSIIDDAIKKYPDDFEMQFYEANEQINAFDRLEKESFEKMMEGTPRIIIGKRSRDNRY